MWGYIRFHIKGDAAGTAAAEILGADGGSWELENRLSEKELVIKGVNKEPSELSDIMKRFPETAVKGLMFDRYMRESTPFFSESGSTDISFGTPRVICIGETAEIGDYPWWDEDRAVYAENGADTLCLVKFNGSDRIFRIPETVNGKTVTEIKGGAFRRNNGIYYIFIPDSVKKISGTFGGGKQLAAVCGHGSFAEKYCAKKNIPFIINTKENIAAAENPPFEFKTDRKGAVITACNYGRRDMTVPDKINGAAVRKISGFGGFEDIENVVLPRGLEEISENAFRECTGLKKITIPKGLKKLGGGAFSGCTSLSEIHIPETVTEINENTFSGCTGLKKAVLPKGLKSIGNGAFFGCTSLSEINIPSGISSISPNAFDNTPFLEKLSDMNGGAVIFNGLLFRYFGDPVKAVIPEGVTEIGGSAFFGCTSLSEVIIPESVGKIGNHAFYGCRRLESIFFPAGLTEIGDYAFHGCKSLSEADIPEGTAVIGECAFSECTGIGKINLPESLKEIGSCAFSDCGELKRLIIPENVRSVSLYEIFCGENLRDIYISENTEKDIRDFRRLSEEDIFPLISRIQRAFIPSVNMKRLKPHIKDFFCICFLTSHEKYRAEEKENYISRIKRRKAAITENIIVYENIPALSGLLSLKLITIREINAYTEYAAANRKTETAAMLLDYRNSSFSQSEIEREEQRRLDRALGSDPFSAAELRKDWSYEKLSDGTAVLKSYKGEEPDITVPPRIGRIPVSRLGNGAFSPFKDKIKNAAARKNITSVTLPEGLSEIGSRAFSGCEKLKSVNIPESVIKLGEKAFYKCSDLRQIVLPQSLTEIGTDCFGGCENLKIINS